MRQIEIDLQTHRAIEAARETLEESENVILHRLLNIGQEGAPAAPRGTDKTAPSAPGRVDRAIPIGNRRTGNWSVEWLGQRYLGKNLREIYVTCIDLLARHDEGLLEKLAQEGNRRRRYVASTPQGLYPRSPHLATPDRDNTYRLGDWHLDINLSRDQAAKRIRRAAALAGVNYGTDLKVQDGLIPL